MGLTFFCDHPPRLDDEAEALARGFAVSQVLAAHQDELKRAYEKHYDRLLREEMDRLGLKPDSN